MGTIPDTPATSGFRSVGRSDTKVVTARVPADLLERVKEFCQERQITFTSFLEVALSDELRKQENAKIKTDEDHVATVRQATDATITDSDESTARRRLA